MLLVLLGKQRMFSEPFSIAPVHVARRGVALILVGGACDPAHAIGTPSAWSGTQLPLVSIEQALEAMSRRRATTFEFARYPDPVLRIVAKPVVRFGRQLAQFADSLAVTARAEGAVGLAANQVGVDARIIVLDPSIVPEGMSSVLVNPVIVDRSSEEDMTFWREICLVLPPDVRVTLMRDRTVTAKSQDVSGRSFMRTLDGEAARALQHELDHLNGILIIDHATDPEDAKSEVFPELQRLELSNRSYRQARAFEREVIDA